MLLIADRNGFQCRHSKSILLRLAQKRARPACLRCIYSGEPSCHRRLCLRLTILSVSCCVQTSGAWLMRRSCDARVRQACRPASLAAAPRRYDIQGPRHRDAWASRGRQVAADCVLGAATIQSSLCDELQLVCSLIFGRTNLVFPMLSMGGLAQARTPTIRR